MYSSSNDEYATLHYQHYAARVTTQQLAIEWYDTDEPADPFAHAHTHSSTLIQTQPFLGASQQVLSPIEFISLWADAKHAGNEQGASMIVSHMDFTVQTADTLHALLQCVTDPVVAANVTMIDRFVNVSNLDTVLSLADNAYVNNEDFEKVQSHPHVDVDPFHVYNAWIDDLYAQRAANMQVINDVYLWFEKAARGFTSIGASLVYFWVDDTTKSFRVAVTSAAVITPIFVLCTKSNAAAGAPAALSMLGMYAVHGTHAVIDYTVSMSLPLPSIGNMMPSVATVGSSVYAVSKIGIDAVWTVVTFTARDVGPRDMMLYYAGYYYLPKAEEAVKNVVGDLSVGYIVVAVAGIAATMFAETQRRRKRRRRR